MCAIYDAKEKLWTNPEPRSFTDLKITHGQLILDVLSTHGSKVAQVFNIYSGLLVAIEI